MATGDLIEECTDKSTDRRGLTRLFPKWNTLIPVTIFTRNDERLELYSSSLSLLYPDKSVV